MMSPDLFQLNIKMCCFFHFRLETLVKPCVLSYRPIFSISRVLAILIAILIITILNITIIIITIIIIAILNLCYPTDLVSLALSTISLKTFGRHDPF